MSVEMEITVICDECEARFPLAGQSLTAAREEARRFGWRVRLKPSVQQPALYSQHVDLCPNCPRKHAPRRVEGAK